MALQRPCVVMTIHARSVHEANTLPFRAQPLPHRHGLIRVCANAFGQACSFNTLPQGRACSKPGARCSPPTVGSGNVGNCTTEAARGDTIVCECQGAPTASYNLTLTPLTPADVNTGDATSTITVVPFNGFTGKVDFTCTISSVTNPAPSCATPAPATVTGPGS